MTSIVLTAPESLLVRDDPCPRPAAGEQRVAIRAAGICGTDLHAYHGDNPFLEFPRILGHELAGVVLSEGAVPVGTAVAVDPMMTCGECRACRVGRRNCCVKMRVFGVHCDGGYREQAAVPSSMLHPLPANVPAEFGALVEPLTIGANACLRGEVAAAEPVVILGAGPIGLCALLCAKAIGAPVMMLDPLPARRALALRLGADAVVDPVGEDDAARVLEFTGGLGPGTVIESAGRASVLSRAIELAGPAGIVVSLMISRESLSLPVTGQLIRKELDLRGSRLNRDLFPSVIAQLANEVIDPTPLITHRFPLGQAPEAFELASSRPGEVVKVVLEVEAQD